MNQSQNSHRWCLIYNDKCCQVLLRQFVAVKSFKNSRLSPLTLLAFIKEYILYFIELCFYVKCKIENYKSILWNHYQTFWSTPSGDNIKFSLYVTVKFHYRWLIVLVAFCVVALPLWLMGGGGGLLASPKQDRS